MKYIVLILINAVIMLVMFLYFRHKITKHLSGEEAADAIREELENLVRDINRITMRNSTIIETKIIDLREAIQDGEKCIVSLGEKTREKKDNDTLYQEMKMASIKQRSRRTPQSKLNPINLKEDYSIEPESSIHSNEKIKEDASVEGIIDKVNIVKEKEQKITSSVGTNEEIIGLHKKGLSLGDIAKQVSKPPGEVEMIIELYS